MLERDGAPPHVCLAGLCHSIYGTNIFKQASVPMQERARVVKRIGSEAEALAYIFCSCNRPTALLEAVDRGIPYWLTNRNDDYPMSLTSSMMRDLLRIEYANLQEQGSTQVLPRVADALRRVIVE